MMENEWDSHNYTIVKHLGKGRSGQTNLARTTTSEQFVVIKQLYQPQTSLDAVTQRLKSVGNHPQLPALVDSWQIGKSQFFAFAYIAAPAITQAESAPWSLAQVENWLLSLLSVLEYLHSFRLVHGDIRPANIRQGPPPILVDFRITQQLDRQIKPLAGGDAAYGAPEQALGQLVYASDLYSLGLVAIHLLTGLAPFDLYSAVEDRWIWPQLVTEPLPQNLSQVLHKLLEQSLDNRYTSAAQAITDLKQSSAPSFLERARSLLPPGAIPLELLTKLQSYSVPNSQQVKLAPVALQIHWQPLYRFTLGITTALALQANILAMGTKTGAVLVCDLAAGDRVYTLEGRPHRDRITALVFHPQTPILFSACSDGTVKLWDLASGKLMQTLSQPGWQPTDLAITPPYLVVGDGSGYITLWELERLTVSHSFNQHQDWVSALATNGERLASISRDRTLRLWLPPERRLLETLRIGPSQGVAIHPEGEYVIVGSGSDVDVWQMGNPATSQRLCSAEEGITTLALSPDARLLAVGTGGNAVRVYEGASGQCVSELAQGWGVVAVVFDGHTLVSSSQDETTTVWQRTPRDRPTRMP
ncbi:MAG: hypothetical protein F6K31_12280 [Symploca sp. SIO2G7]|nr:hypothetical protein [Symploca sp. SIO2G7]